MCRYGGLQCPSEVLSLRWQDVDWERDRITVTSPKTAHHPGKGLRVIPLFPELKLYLSEAWEIAETGQEYVIPPKYWKAAQGPQGWRNCNLRTQFERIIRRAGLTPWPCLFHNLRASRETELAQSFSLHVVTAWLGNTPRIAMRHLQTIEVDFAKAVQNPVQQPAATRRNAPQNPPNENGPEEVTNTKARPNSGPCQNLRLVAASCRKPLMRQQLTSSGEDRNRVPRFSQLVAGKHFRTQRVGIQRVRPVWSFPVTPGCSRLWRSRTWTKPGQLFSQV